MKEQQKSFFEKMGEILNSPLPGTMHSPAEPSEASATNNTDQINENDGSLLARIKDILNTPLPGSKKSGSDNLTDQIVDLEKKPIEITDADYPKTGGKQTGLRSKHIKIKTVRV